MKLLFKIILSVILLFLLSVFHFSQKIEISVKDTENAEKTSEYIGLDSKICFNPEKKKPKLKSYKDYKKSKGKKIFYSDCCPIQIHEINNPKPIYPSDAKAVGAKGLVSVRVFVNEKGKVFWAEVESGHPLLRAIALRTACQTTFEPYVCICGKKEARQFQTVIYYNFTL